MEQLKVAYKSRFRDKGFLASLFYSLAFLALALVINFYAGTYASESASSPVSDIVLSNVPAYDLDVLFIYGSFLFFFLILSLCALRPHQMPFIIKSVALFVIIRSIFITLTHIGPSPSQILIHSDVLSKLTFDGDLFFSGHTGLPFLLALTFWRNKIIRSVFLLFSFSFATIVLLAHMHYTIDVLAAFFITYSIYHIALKIFAKDRTGFLASS